MQPINLLPTGGSLLSQFDLESKLAKASTDLLSQLPVDGTVKATISAVTSQGNLMLLTNQGKFFIANQTDLHQGEQINLKLSLAGQQLLGTIIAVNNVSCPALAALPVFLVEPAVNQRLKNRANPAIQLNIDPLYAAKQQLKTTLTYLNLASLSKNSAIYQVLKGLESGQSIELKIIENSLQRSSSPYQVNGEVIEQHQTGYLIKTAFGILLAENSQLSVGQKLTLEVKIVNGTAVNNANFTVNIADFLFGFNKYWPALQSLTNIFKLPKSSITSQDNLTNFDQLGDQLVDSPDAKLLASLPIHSQPFQPETALLKLLDSSENQQMLKSLSESAHQLKNLLVAPSLQGPNTNGWQMLSIPIRHQEQVIDQHVYVQHQATQLIRFVVEVPLEALGNFQIDGLIKLAASKGPESFNLVIRFKKHLSQQIQSTVSEIFLLNQQVTGIGGVIAFEQVAIFCPYSNLTPHQAI